MTLRKSLSCKEFGEEIEGIWEERTLSREESEEKNKISISNIWDGYEQLISNGGRFQPAFAESDKKEPMISEESRHAGLQNQLYPSIMLSGEGQDLL